MCVASLILSFAATVCYAGSGQVIVTPPNTVRNTSGLRLSVDTQWVDASGYRDVRVRLTTANGGPSPSDRALQVELSPNAYGSADFTARQTITLAQGATQSTAHMLVPQGQPWHQLRVNVFEQGSYWKELSSMTSISNPGEEWSEAVPSFLLIDAKAPTTTDRESLLTRYNLNPGQFPETKDLVDLRGVEALVKRGMYYPESDGQRPADAELLRRVSTTARLELLPPQALPDKWLGLSAFDCIVVALGDLQAMAQQHQPQFRALAAWLTAGGNLIVYDIGANYTRLAQLEELLELSPATRDGDYAAADWQPAEQRDFNDNTTRSFQEMQNYGYYVDEKPSDGTTVASTVTPFDTAFGGGSEPRFLTRPAGMGVVAAMATANPYPGGSTEWSWVLNTVTSRRYMWYLRHGLSLRRENSDYWDLLVPNTGMAPVWEFCILITLFAVVIGPVNYFVLFRQKRPYLLLVTIPIGALVVTLGLFFYAIASDGLGTRARVRSYTHIDQTAGRAASWSRQSYYAGLAPSRGLSFPADAAVYVSEQHPRQEYSGGFRRQRTFVWNDDQNFRAGYMSSRVTSQFLVVRSAETAAAVRLDQSTAPKQAQNGLGGAIEQLLLRDKAGDYYWAEDVAASGQFTLAPAKFEDGRDNFKKAFLAHRPSPPPGIDTNQFNNWYGGWYGGWGIDNSQPPPRATSSLMEQRLRQIQNAKHDTLAPGSYIAIVSTSAEVPLGVAGAREEGSFHVIEGKF